MEAVELKIETDKYATLPPAEPAEPVLTLDGQGKTTWADKQKAIISGVHGYYRRAIADTIETVSDNVLGPYPVLLNHETYRRLSQEGTEWDESIMTSFVNCIASGTSNEGLFVDGRLLSPTTNFNTCQETWVVTKIKGYDYEKIYALAYLEIKDQPKSWAVIVYWPK